MTSPQASGFNLHLWISGTEQVDTSAQPLAADNAGQQKVVEGHKHKRILCFDSSGEAQPQTTAVSTSSPTTCASTSQSVPQPKKDAAPVARTRPNILGGNRPKRRLQPVRCLKDPKAAEKTRKEVEKPKDPGKKHLHKQDRSTCTEESARAGTDSSQRKAGNQPDPERTRAVAQHHEDADGAEDGQRSRAGSSKVDRNQDKPESSRKEPTGKVLPKAREGRVEKKPPPQEAPNVTANKENEMEDAAQEKQAASSSSAAKDFGPQPAAQAAPDSQLKTPKAPSKTSSLAKQAAEMLHGLQGHAPSPELPAHTQEDSANVPRTPGRQKKGKDGEGTPKHLLPPNTPDVPSCSPVSEAGSENSINMAAHTLMILSRATIARTGTPLKDSLRQDGVGEKIPTSSKNSKKRKMSSPTDTPPAKKDRVSTKQIFQSRWINVTFALL